MIVVARGLAWTKNLKMVSNQLFARKNCYLRERLYYVAYENVYYVIILCIKMVRYGSARSTQRSVPLRIRLRTVVRSFYGNGTGTFLTRYCTLAHRLPLINPCTVVQASLMYHGPQAVSSSAGPIDYCLVMVIIVHGICMDTHIYIQT